MSEKMWELGAQRFKEGPSSNGADKYYEKVKAELRQKFGKDNIRSVADKQRLKALACTGGLHDEQAQAHAALSRRESSVSERDATIAKLSEQLAQRDATNAKLKEQLAERDATITKLKEQLGVAGGMSRVALTWEPFKELLGGEAAGCRAEAGETKLADTAEDFVKYFQCAKIRTGCAHAPDVTLVASAGSALPTSFWAH